MGRLLGLVFGLGGMQTYGCAVCGFGQDGSQWAFIFTTALLTFIPLLMAAGICLFIKKYLKWISTALVLIGILLTNLNYYPINIYFHGLGVVGWTIAGFLSKDKAVLVNLNIKVLTPNQPR